MNSPPAPLVHLDDVPERTMDSGDLAFARRMLGREAGAARTGLSRYRVPAGRRQMPVHQHGIEEEIFYVVAGAGLSWQDGEACAVGAGDAIVHPPAGHTHTFFAAVDAELVLLAFSSGSEARLTWLPRANVMWAGGRWVPVDAPHPFEAEAAAGALERPQPGERPANVVAAHAVPVGEFPGVEIRALGAAGGATKSGLNLVTLEPGAAGTPFHCHALEEELFVVLDGGGALRLGDGEHELRTGHVLARPPATGVAHALTAGADGMTYLAFGTRVPGDSIHYPDEGQLWLRGLNLRLDVG